MRDTFAVIIRLAAADDAAFLPEIERSAARAFLTLPDLGWTPGDFVESEDEHLASIARGTLWVAEHDGEIVGFVSASIVGAELHIDEIDVPLDHQKKGIGRLLVASALSFALERGLEAVTLTTFREVAWNAPFYKSVGFRVLDSSETGPRLQAILDLEVLHGLPREKRCAMRMIIGY